MRKQWCIPPTANAAFACNMEDVLEVYTRPYDTKRPVVCMDEMPKQLLEDPCKPLIVKPGQGQRRRVEWADVMRTVADPLYPQAEKIILVLDNLNPHMPAAFYEAFELAEARRLVERFEFHFTPKHRSWG